MTSALVYSTDAGRMCPTCRRAIAACVCLPAAPSPAGDGIVRVSRQTRGRAGKDVTLVTGLALDTAALKRTARQLQAACGCGGTVKGGVIEVQGDHRERVIGVLQQHGWTVRRAGG